MAERSADDIQQEIEQARVQLANSIDEVVVRVSPNRLADRVKIKIKQGVQTPQGKAVIAGVGLVLILMTIRRIRMD